jgi:transcription termination factor Rho
MHLAELKAKSPSDLLSFAESLQIENASSLRKQDMMFAILKNLAENDQAIQGDGTLEILPDGFAFLRSPESNFLPGPDDIYAYRRHGGRADPGAEGRRAVFRAAEAGEREFRAARGGSAPDQLRQPDAALSGSPAEDGNGEFPERREGPDQG